MDKQGSYWFLEHVTTGKKLVLQTGDNTLGRHSSCKFVLRNCDFLSRKHANFIVGYGNDVVVQQENALNGVFVNETKLKTRQQTLSSGDRIGLGVETDMPNAKVPATYAIFILKQVHTKDDDIIIISDEEGDGDKAPLVAGFEVRKENNAADSILQTQRSLHLPKLPDIKKEVLSNASKEIENIFGAPDEELLESVLQINPYVYKQLTNNANFASSRHSDKICDGDIIDLKDEASYQEVASNKTTSAITDVVILDKDYEYDENFAMSQAVLREMKEVASNKTTSAITDIVILDKDYEYDENFAMSQAVLREMKEEMADESEDYNNKNNRFMDEEEFVPPNPFKTGMTLQIDDDDIILIEDEDDELFNKVQDWSSKLLSQNNMSQVFPLDDGVQITLCGKTYGDDDDGTVEAEHPISINRRSQSLCIDSSEDEAMISLQDKNKTAEPPKIRRCNVRSKSVGIPESPGKKIKFFGNTYDDNDNGVLQSELPISMKRRSRSLRSDSSEDEASSALQDKNKTAEPSNIRSCNVRLKSVGMLENLENVSIDNSDLEKINNQKILDVAVVPELSIPVSQIKSTRCKGKETKSNEDAASVSKPEKNKSKKIEIFTNREHKIDTRTLRSSRLLNTSNSCYMEQPLSSPGKQLISIHSKEDSYDIEVNKEPAIRNISTSKKNQMILEETEGPGPSTSSAKDTQKKCTIHQKSDSTLSDFEDTATITQNRKNAKKTGISLELDLETLTNSRILDTRNNLFLTDSKERSDGSTKDKDTNKNLKNKNQNVLEVSIPSTQKEPLENAPEPEENFETPSKKSCSARLLYRSKSFFMEVPLGVPAKSIPTLPRVTHPMNDENSRGPILIEPPNLPKCRGKLRGVSAVSKEILAKERSVNYETKMKEKWYQKPKDKQKDLDKIKEMRREQLKKLAERLRKPINSTERKRKQTSVRMLGNCNRGDFLTKDIQPSTAKRHKLDTGKEAIPQKMPQRRATIESFSQQLNYGDLAHSKRLPERKEAEIARSRRTCNRVTFSDMDRDFQLNLQRNIKSKNNRHVRFNNNVQIRIIDRIEGADKKVRNLKDTKKLSLSKYAERRDWALALGKPVSFTDCIIGQILGWGNKWLQLRSVDAVAETDVLMPIGTEFQTYKQYQDTLIPLMKVELLATIEREYQLSKTTFEVCLQSFSSDYSRSLPRYVLITQCNTKHLKKFDLYTLSMGEIIKETFASMPRMQRISGNVYELTFEILQKGNSAEELTLAKTLTVRPVVDNIRVELGAFNAVYQLRRSPLFQRILKPSEHVISFDIKSLKNTDYKGFKPLNDQQKDICQSTWLRLIDDSTPSITLIQGPPGTGKSVVISNLALQCMYGRSNHQLDRKILICAHSNAAVDNITQYLKRTRDCMTHTKFELLRFGFFEKMSTKAREVSLEHYLNQKRAEKRDRLTTSNIEHLKQHQHELKKEIAELKRKTAQMSSVAQQLQNKEKMLRLLTEQLNPPLTPREAYEYSKLFVLRANIICTTLSSCVKLATFIDYFDACIIDEATQCTEPWTLLPLQFGIRGLVLVGDTQQLPATVLSQKAIDFGLSNSMFDRIQRNLKQQQDKPRGYHFVHTKVFKLSTQYRMHPEICRWPNSYFYEDQLVNADCTNTLIAPIIPYCVINLSYTRDTSDASSRSISNEEEAHFVANLLCELDKHMPAHKYSYGLITPYSNHCYTLSQVIPSHMNIKPRTVDAYQGQERDIIILSNARTRGAGFLTNYQRLNVAITRPQRCLIVCGNFDDLQGLDMWRHLLDDARNRKIYFDLQRTDVEFLNQSLMRKLLVKPIN